MASTRNKFRYCKFGSQCPHPETCQYAHYEQYYNKFHDYSSSKRNNYNKSYDQYQYEYEDQNVDSSQSYQSCSKNQNSSYTMTTQRQMSPYSGDHSNHQGSYPHKKRFDSNQQSNEVPKPQNLMQINFNNCNILDSASISSKNDSSTSFTIDSSIWIEHSKAEIKVLFEESLPEVFSQHQSLIDEQLILLNENDDDVKFSKETNVQELKDQLETFEKTISELSIVNPSTLKDAQHLQKRLKREIERLKAHLPIYARRQQLIDTIQSNRVVILKAETGSGKSSQLIQYLVDAGFADHGQIICTQPRRLAARELASRVAKEFDCKVGEEVGCHVGASRPQISHLTQIRFVTDAVLLNEYQMDPMLSAYSLIIIDEAHERRIDTDLLFGALKICLQRRPDMKLVIMSATLDDKLLSKYYNDAIVIEVPGRTFPIEDVYAIEDPENYVDEAINKVLDIHANQPPGDILVFLTGQDEIDRAIDEVTRRIDPPESAMILPLHGKLNEDDTKAIFMSTGNSGRRKIIFSTNIAETSVTIDGIRYVIDSGMVKEVMWDSKRHMRILKTAYTTQSSVKQRRGRAGRTSIGKCFHLYTYDTYQSLDICSRAEILCTQPSIAVLKLKHLNIVDNIAEFDWLESPADSSLQETVKCLTWLNAIDSKTEKLTDLGRSLAKLGLDPMLSVMILTGQKFDCFSHVLALAGMLSVVQNIWWRSKDDQSKQLSDEIRSSFIYDTDIGGDYIVLLRIFLEWYALDDHRERRKTWCIKHMIRWKSMKLAYKFVRELAYQIAPTVQLHFSKLNDELIKQIVHCICAGFFQNLAISNGPIRAGYQLAVGTIDTVARIHRSSTVILAQKPPKFILYHEILNINETNYLTVICPVELDWLNKSWLDSLPRSPLQCVFEGYTFMNLGPTLLLSLVGRRCHKLPQLEEQLNVLFEVDRIQSKLTIWGHKDKLVNAQQYLQQILNKEREKLRNELQEFEIIGSTRILLGAGAEPRLALIDDEYVKIFLTNLPKKITEEQIQAKCEQYGQVRNITMIRTNQNSSSASVTFVECDNARMAVTELAHKKWDDYEIYVRPSYTRTSIDTRKQNYTLKAQWYMTESEGNGRVGFNKPQAAQQAYQLFSKRHNFNCQFELNPVSPTVKCSWPLTPHHGHAIIHFELVEQAQEALEAQYEYPFRIQEGRRSNTSIYVRNVPRHFDETNLKAIFTQCADVMILRARQNTTMSTPVGMENIVRELFNTYSSFQSQSIFIEPNLNDGHVIAYVQFTDDQEMRIAVNDISNKNLSMGSGKLRIKIQQPRQLKFTTKRNEMKEDEFRIKFSKLPAHVDERFLLQELNQHNLSNSMTYVAVYRIKLPESYSFNRSNIIMTEDNKKALMNLKSLFSSQDHFYSEPEIDIRPATEDGRVAAYIRFHDPREIITAIDICDSLNNDIIRNIGLKYLHFIPLISHRIVLHDTLAQAIKNKLEQTIKTIQDDSKFSNINLFKKSSMINDKPNVVISIRGENIPQLYRARILFNDLLNGLLFQLYDHSWVTMLFDTTGQKFLRDLQNRTRTYIWWNWKSTFLRIFGEDQACQDAHKQINTFIQETILQREYSITIPIPKDCIRQCIQNSNLFRELNNKKTKVVINMIKHFIVINGDREIVNECERKVNELLNKFASISNQSNEKIMIDMKNTCPICMCDFDSPYAFQQCGHTFCHSCLTAYFDTYFDATMSFTSFKLTCPIQECNEVCLIRDIVSILGFERMARLAMIAFQIYIRRNDNNLVQCMGIDCKQVYRPSKYSTMYFCDQCIKVYCTSCEVEYHTGMTCEHYKRLHEEKNEDAILEYNLGKLSYKPCPKCRTPIDKFTGCNAVKCTICNIQFCWRCLTTDETDIHEHFTNPSSSCYNKMLDGDVNDMEFI
ncbi:unnamed protein product [Adineta steineri]|uniref:RNA helicase n=1 Tax=Adineta steineri TaxID=433720 RepID=A0A819GF21_9BILA|nr:unnamed protein product [Adineta steineri]